METRSSVNVEYLSKCPYITDVQDPRCSEFYYHLTIAALVIAAITTTHSFGHLIYASSRFGKTFWVISRDREAVSHIVSAKSIITGEHILNPLMIQTSTSFLFCVSRLIFYSLNISHAIKFSYTGAIVLFSSAYFFASLSIVSYLSALLQLLQRMHNAGINVVNVGDNCKFTLGIRNAIIKWEQRIFFIVITSVMMLQIGVAFAIGVFRSSDISKTHDINISLKLYIASHSIWVGDSCFIIFSSFFVSYWLIEVLIDNCTEVDVIRTSPQSTMYAISPPSTPSMSNSLNQEVSISDETEVVISHLEPGTENKLFSKDGVSSSEIGNLEKYSDSVSGSVETEIGENVKADEVAEVAEEDGSTRMPHVMSKGFLFSRVRETWAYMKAENRNLIIRTIVFCIGSILVCSILITALLLIILATEYGKPWTNETIWRFNFGALFLVGFFTLNVTVSFNKLFPE